MSWQPVLDGELADKAHAAIRDIAREVTAAALRAAGAPGRAHRPDQLAVFWAYAAAQQEAQAYGDPSAECACSVEALLDRLTEPQSDIGLYGGLAGIAWALCHVSEGGGDADEILGPIDRILVGALSSAIRWDETYDLIGGLAGLGVYFLEREASAGRRVPEARRGLDGVVRHLAALAERDGAGVAWHTRPELLPDHQRRQAPAGYYNCGVAHGIPGVVALLGRIAALDDPPAGAAELCAQSMRWLRAQDMGQHPRGRFPAWIVPGVPSDRCRAAWCYGDPGVAAALWAASIRIGAPIEEWRRLAAECSARPAELCDVGDACLCHGAVGLAHLFNRFFQASGDPRFRAAAQDWFERALAMRRPGAGVAGFLALRSGEVPDEIRWTGSYDFLDGAPGIGLALLAAVADEEPGWDRLLLADIPPGAQTTA